MSRKLADLLFRPRSVLVYGASSDPDKLSGRPLDYLRRFGFAGQVYAVNPRRTAVQGVHAYPGIDVVPGPVDLVIVVVPVDKVLTALGECAKHGAGAAIVFASGFGEAGAEGEALEAQVADLARRTGMRIIGPNCLGTFSVVDRTYATFSTAFDDDTARADSAIGLVSQSGAVGTFSYSAMNALGVGVRYFANTGNQVDVTAIEVLRALVDEPGVDVLLGHLEDGRDVDGVASLAAAAAAAGKPLILLKGGRTAAGARAVHVHTGSVAGDHHAFEDAVTGNGGIVVNGLEDWIDTALAVIGGRRARGPRVSIVTLSGGCAAIGADAALDAGLVVDTWASVEDRERIARRLPSFASTLNPIDMTGVMLTDLNSLAETLEIVDANEETDSVCVVLGNADKGSADIVVALQRAYEVTGKPFVVSWTGGSGRPRELLLRSGVPTFSDPGRALRALGRATRLGTRRSVGV